MKCIIDGAYGFNNVGDEAMLSTASSVLSEMAPEIDIVVSSYLPHRINELHGLASSKDLLLGTLIRNILKLKIKNLTEQVRFFKSIDLMVFAGGSLLNDSKGIRSLFVILYKVLISKLFGFKVVFWGVSIGPIRTKIAKAMISWILNKSELAILRDESSYLLAKQLSLGKGNIKQGVDILFSAETFRMDEKVSANNDSQNKMRIGLSLRPYPPIIGVDVNKFDTNMINQVSRLCEKLSKKMGVTIVPLVFSEGKEHKDDLGLLLKVKDLSINTEFDDIDIKISDVSNAHFMNHLKALFRKYQSLDLVIGERFHSLVISQLLGVSYIGLSYDAKIDELANLAGTKPYIVDLVSALENNDLYIKVLEIFEQMENKKIKFDENNMKILKQAGYDRNAIKELICSI